MKRLRGLDNPVRDLDDQPLVDDKGEVTSARRIMAQVLRRAGTVDEGGKNVDALRAETLAYTIYRSNGKHLDLEDADYDTLLGAVTRDRLLPVMSKALCLRVLNEAEEIALNDGQPNRAERRRAAKKE